MGSRGALQYSDLHGLPCILILCEKGRMGDTFPETFCCLDLRIRTAVQLSTFVQEFGRLCRYPSVVSAPESAFFSLDPAVQHDPEMQRRRIHMLQQALCYAHSTTQAQQPLTMTDLLGEHSCHLSLIGNYNKATLIEAFCVLSTRCVNPYKTPGLWCVRLAKEAVSTTHQAT